MANLFIPIILLPNQAYESCHRVPGPQSPMGLMASGMNGAEAASEDAGKGRSFLRGTSDDSFQGQRCDRVAPSSGVKAMGSQAGSAVA